MTYQKRVTDSKILGFFDEMGHDCLFYYYRNRVNHNCGPHTFRNVDEN